MSIWFPDVSDRFEAREATRIGTYAASGFVVMGLLGLGMLMFGTADDLMLDPLARYVGLALVAVETMLGAIAAYRFWDGKGSIVGSIVLGIFTIETIFKIVTAGFLGVLGYLIHFAVFMGLLNGVRGAWALRGAAQELSPEVAQAFE